MVQFDQYSTKCPNFDFRISSLKGNYDIIAPIYDRFNRLVLGRAPKEAQLYLLAAIAPGSRILIAGGGTGWILEEISKLHRSGLIITYIDASPKMMALANKRNLGNNKVNFITSPIETAAITGQYAVALTPFLFDNLSDHTLQKAFRLIDEHLYPQGLWLYCDFQKTGVLWQRITLWIMYRFFRMLCSIGASRLPDTEGLFRHYGYEIIQEQTFSQSFIVGRVYKKK